MGDEKLCRKKRTIVIFKNILARMESLKLKFTENKQTLVCSYTSTVTPINALETLY